MMKLDRLPPMHAKNDQQDQEKGACCVSAKRVVEVAIAVITIGAAFYLVKCGLKEGSCKVAPESSDAYSFLHDIMGLLN